MRIWLLATLVLGGCLGRSDPQPIDPECAYPPDGGTQLYEVTAKVRQFETQGDPAGSVEVSLHTAWDIPGVFPTTCAPLARFIVGQAQGWEARFPRTSGPIALVIATILRGSGLATAINDKRVGLCDGVCFVGSTDAPYPVWTLRADTFAVWKAAMSRDFHDHGLAVVTYRDREGQPAAGVAPVAVEGDGLRTLAPGREVYFLAADRATIESRETTGASGTALLPLLAGNPLQISGSLAGVTYEKLYVAAAADSVFFEQVDVAPLR